MKDLFFYDKERMLVMHWLVSFPNVSDEIKTLSVTATFRRTIFSGEVGLLIEQDSVLKFAEELKQMYTFRKKHIRFSSFDDLLNVELKEDECGVIDVELKVSDKTKSITLRLAYNFDQSFLPELIRELESIPNIESKE